MWGINSGAGDASECTLPGKRQGVQQANPGPAIRYWSIPDFFLSQSNSIFSRPISE